MSTVLIKNNNLYKLYKDLPYTFDTACLHLIDCLIKKYNKEKAIVTVYMNLDEKWLQLISENNLYDTNEKELIWEHDVKKSTFDWKYPAFYLGQAVSIEIKNMEAAVISELSLNYNDSKARLEEVDGKDILTKYSVATRLTIADLNYHISGDLISNLINKITTFYQNRISMNLLDIFFIVIDQNKTYQWSDDKLIEITHSKNLQPLNAKKINPEKIINSEIIYDDKEFTIQFELYKTDKQAIYLSNKTRTIKELSLLGNRVLEQLNEYSINIRIINLKLNLFRTDFNWQVLPFEVLIKHAENILSSNFKLSESINAKDVTDQFSFDELENLKMLLTKSFDGLTNTNKFDNFEIKKDKLQFSYHADDDKKITINLIKTKQKDFADEWLQLQPIREENIEQIYEYNVTFNVEHPFFKHFLGDKENANKIEQLIICYAIAETVCRLDGNDVTQLKYEINKLLRGT